MGRSRDLADGSYIADDAVTTAKIADNNVTVAKLPSSIDLSSNAVSGIGMDKLYSGSVTGGTSHVISLVNIFSSSYKAYRLFITNFQTNQSQSTSQQVVMRLNDSSGAISTSNYYMRNHRMYSGHGAYETDNVAGGTYFPLGYGSVHYSTSDANYRSTGSFEFYIAGTDSGHVCNVHMTSMHSHYSSNKNSTGGQATGHLTPETQQITGVDIFMVNNTHKITDYDYVVYGVVS